MTSTVWENMHETNNVIVVGDIKPWAGYSKTDVLDNIRVNSVKINFGTTYDTANLVYSDADFGDEAPLFKPIKIMVVEGEGEDAKLSTIFRGFVTSNNGTLSNSAEKMSINCKDYKWYLARRTRLRGQWYSVDGAYEAPSPIGTGLSIGKTKFVFEQYRANPQDNGGYLQNKEMVFNKGGIPNCFTENWTSSQCLFYYPKVASYDEYGREESWDESQGLRTDYWQSKSWNGKFWRWVTILGHIEQYWIDPYNAKLTNVEFHKGDMLKIADIQNDQPIDFSLEGMNAVEAIDEVVKNLPGRWFWYLEYGQPQVKIRIREYLSGSDEVLLKVEDGKLATNGTNVLDLNVKRDGTNATKYAIAQGRHVKLTTTIKLIPLWPKFGVKKDKDFEDYSDFKAWRNYVDQKYYNKSKNNDAITETYSKEQIERWDRIYRHYGIAIDGETLQKFFVDSGNTPLTPDDLKFAGNLAFEYASFETDLKKFFFNNLQYIRGIEPPNFSRYDKDYVVFMWDESHSANIKDRNASEVEKTRKSSGTDDNETVNDKRFSNKLQWVTAEDEGAKFKVDEKTGEVIFDVPQFQREANAYTGATNEDIAAEALQYLSKASHDGSAVGGVETEQVRSRDVYLTATFTTDVAAIMGRKVDNSLIDKYSGADFAVYLNRGSCDIIQHIGAYYPISAKNRTESTTSYSTDTMDKHIVGETIRKCDDFDNYKRTTGEDADELLRALISFIEGYSRVAETVSATIPYLETGYELGDKLKKIYGTNYTDLSSVLVGISWQSQSDSDIFYTKYTFNNQYLKNSKKSSHITQKNLAREQGLRARDSFTFPDRETMAREPRKYFK